jgi:eukaryotic-like serine/threonine-protein kinase
MNETRQIESTVNRCPVCGGELPAGTPANLCPRCLLKVGLGSQPTAPMGTTPASALPASSASPARRPVPGETFGHYRIVRLLGEGGMGASYEAEDLDTGRRLALKVLTHALDSADARKRFLREGRLAASINHPNSVYVFGTEEIDGIPVIAMELMSGGTLGDRVKARGPLPIGEAVDCVLQVIAGLEAAHATGILHRDIKPSNCFVDSDGTVKVGDYGLSISKGARWDSTLTVAGAFLGTPAFSSPEQLRGEDLNVRSDIYSVGVTLYYLLTGRTPFEAQNVVQLLASVLEGRPPSPAKWRRDIPKELCRTVLRCLEKDPDERFKTYADLRDALYPYASTAPTPATLGLRFLAGCIDSLLLSVPLVASTVLWIGSLDALVTPDIYQNPRLIIVLLKNLALASLYYGLLEGRWGASLGKAVCRLRLVRADRNPPGFLRASLRAALYIGVSLLPGAVLWSLRLDWTRAEVNWIAAPLSLAQPALLALMFLTARRRNGFAGVHDLATGTRVVLRSVPQARPELSAADEALPDTEALPRIGPYHVLGQVVEGDKGLLLGYDARLLRRVWVRMVPPGTPPVAQSLRQLGRPGRVRWLSGRREPTESWDAYEALTGKPLSALIGEESGWGQARFWLLDLAEELRAAEQDGSLPELDVDRVWITSGNRAKLLDFPVRGNTSAPPVQEPPATPPEFLSQLARSALVDPAARSAATQSGRVTPPLPLHARELVNSFATAPGIVEIVNGLKAVQHRLPAATRARRLGLLAGCAALPVLGMALAVFALHSVGRLAAAHPDYAALNECLLQMNRMERQVQPGRAADASQRDAIEVYIAGRFRRNITNTVVWNSFQAASSIAPAQRQLAEQIIARRPPPTPEEFAAAETVVTGYLKGTPDAVALTSRQAVKPLSVGLLAGYGYGLLLIILPCWLASLLFRGGAMLHLFGLAVAGRDGTRASRGRVLWRNVLAGLPFVLLPVAVLPLGNVLDVTSAGIALAGLVAALALLSALLPQRSLQDRLAGTWLVPK